MNISFTLYNRYHTPISNDALYQIRKRIAENFQLFDFGEVEETPNNKFHNTNLYPDVDEYFDEENVLHILFNIINPRNDNRGDISGVLLTGIPNLKNWVSDFNPEINLLARIDYF